MSVRIVRADPLFPDGPHPTNDGVETDMFEQVVNVSLANLVRGVCQEWIPAAPTRATAKHALAWPAFLLRPLSVLHQYQNKWAHSL